MVVEADESDGTFVKLPADIALVTNIDPEHLDHYGDFDSVREAFRAFVENVPFYGFAVMCIDHPEVQALVGRIEDRRIITYGGNPQADVRYSDLRIDGRKSRVHRADPRPRRPARPSGIEDLVDLHAGRAQRPERDRRGRRRASSRHRRRRDPQGPGQLRRREAALHPHRRLERRRDLRRLRPSPGRDRGGAARRRARSRRAASSPSSSRTATRGCAISSTGSAPASTMPTRSSSRRSIRPARRRSKASTATRWSRACGSAAIATRGRLRAPKRSRGRSPRSCRPGDMSSASAPARSRSGPMRCRSSWQSWKARHDAGPRRHSTRRPRPAHAERRIAPFTWFRVGGPAELLFQPADAEDLALVPARNSIRRCRSPSSASARTSSSATAASTASSIRLSAKGFGRRPRGGDRIRVGAALPDKRLAALRWSRPRRLRLLPRHSRDIGGALAHERRRQRRRDARAARRSDAVDRRASATC